VRNLVVGVLGLEELVEPWDDIAVDMVRPEARGSARLCIWRQEMGSGLEVFEVFHDDG
jgi:hypothetical protein